MFGTRSVSLPKPSASAECHNLTFGAFLPFTCCSMRHRISFYGQPWPKSSRPHCVGEMDQHVCQSRVNTVDKLKKRLIAAWSDFWQDVVDTETYQWRKRFQASGGNFEHLLWTNSRKRFAFFHMYLAQVPSAHGVRFLLWWCLVDRPTLLNCKALSLLRIANEQKVKC